MVRDQEVQGSSPCTPRCWRRLFFALLFLAPSAVRADEIYDLEAQSLLGHTGYVLAPSAYTMNHRESGVALHRFVLGLSHARPKHAEFGVAFDLEEVTPISPFTRATFRARAPHFGFHGKYRAFRRERHGFDASLGFWRRTYYAVAALPRWGKFRLEAGPSIARRTDASLHGGGFGALSYTAGVHRVFADYESQNNSGGAGWRYLLSDAIRMDLFLTGIGRRQYFFDRFFFGLTIAGRP